MLCYRSYKSTKSNDFANIILPVAIPSAIIPPVLVPPTQSNSFCIGWPAFFSIASKISSIMSPFMPPPSRTNILIDRNSISRPNMMKDINKHFRHKTCVCNSSCTWPEPVCNMKMLPDFIFVNIFFYCIIFFTILKITHVAKNTNEKSTISVVVINYWYLTLSPASMFPPDTFETG